MYGACRILFLEQLENRELLRKSSSRENWHLVWIILVYFKAFVQNRDGFTFETVLDETELCKKFRSIFGIILRVLTLKHFEVDDKFLYVGC